jgi:hypothetical protein
VFFGQFTFLAHTRQILKSSFRAAKSNVYFAVMGVALRGGVSPTRLDDCRQAFPHPSS